MRSKSMTIDDFNCPRHAASPRTAVATCCRINLVEPISGSMPVPALYKAERSTHSMTNSALYASYKYHALKLPLPILPGTEPCLQLRTATQNCNFSCVQCVHAHLLYCTQGRSSRTTFSPRSSQNAGFCPLISNFPEGGLLRPDHLQRRCYTPDTVHTVHTVKPNTKHGPSVANCCDTSSSSFFLKICIVLPSSFLYYFPQRTCADSNSSRHRQIFIPLVEQS